MTLVLCVVTVVLVAVIYGYEREMDRLNVKVSEWRAAYWKSLNMHVQWSVGAEEDLAETRRALRRCQESNEELQDEVDRLRAERVVPESVGAGGQC